MIHGMHTGTRTFDDTIVACASVCKNTQKRMRVAGRMYERAQGSIDRYVCARARTRGRGCRPPGLLPPPPQLHHRPNVTGAKASGERARARAGWLDDEIWQQRFCFRHGFNVRRRCIYTTNRTTGSGYIYILLLQSVNCGGTGDVWPSVRDWNRK